MRRNDIRFKPLKMMQGQTIGNCLNMRAQPLPWDLCLTWD